MKKNIVTLSLLMALSGLAVASDSSTPARSAELFKEPFNKGGHWINPQSKLIMFKHPAFAGSPVQTQFMSQPAQAKFASELKSVGISYKDNGHGLAEAVY